MLGLRCSDSFAVAVPCQVSCHIQQQYLSPETGCHSAKAKPDRVINIQAATAHAAGRLDARATSGGPKVVTRPFRSRKSCRDASFPIMIDSDLGI